MFHCYLVRVEGLEPPTICLEGRCYYPPELHPHSDIICYALNTVKIYSGWLNNNMRLTTGMMSYPLFPDWIFVDSLVLDPEIKHNLIAEIQDNPKHEAAHGWVTPKKHFTPNLKALNQLIGSKFVDSAKYQFSLKGSLLNIEIGESWGISLNPGHCWSSRIQHHRWYQSLYFLDVAPSGGSLYFEDTTSKRQVTSEGVQEFFHYIDPEPNKIVFFPAHIINGITTNKSNNPALYITSTFIINA